MRIGEAEIGVVADGDQFNRQMQRMMDETRRRFIAFGRDATDATDRAGVSTRRFATVLGGLVGTLGRVAAAGTAVGSLVGLLGVAATAAIQLAAALAPAVGIVAALPAAVGVAAAAAATLQVALVGVGDAFAAAVSGDAEEFADALETLAPNARAAAQALRDITPQFQALQQSVQNAFFEGFDQTLLDIAATLAGPLTAGMSSAAAALAGITTRLGEAVASAAGVVFVESSFASLSNVLANLQEPLGRLVEGLASLGSAINLAFGGQEAGAALADLIDRFATFVNRAADSGAAIAWVEDALAVFRQLGAILSPIGGILDTIGEAASRSGGNVLGGLGAGLAAVEEFLSSAEGMSALVGVFETLGEVGAAFGDILGGLLPIIAPLVGALVSGLVPTLEAITPLLIDIAAAAAPLFGQVLAAVLPLIPPLAQLAQQILPLVATLLSALVTAAQPLLAVLVQLLVSVIQPLLPALMPLVELLGTLAGEIAIALVPIIQTLGDILLWVTNEIIIPFLIPVLEFLIGIIGEQLVAAVEGLGTVFSDVFTLIGAAATWLGEHIGQRVALIQAGWQTLQDKLRSGYETIKARVIDPLRNIISGLGDIFSSVTSALSGDWSTTVTKLLSGVTKIKNGIDDMWSPLWEGFKAAINSVIRGWNSLSFSVPSVDLGPLGTVGGFSISTPNIPTLQTSGFSFGEGLVNLHPNEAIVNAKDRRGIGMLADALAEASRMTADTGLGGTVVVRVYIGDRELTDIIDVQIDRHDEDVAHDARNGSGTR